MTQIYYKYSDYLKNKYDVKVYKLPTSIPVTCPNRDGFCGTSGCTFCGEIGAGYENLPDSLTIAEQIRMNKEHIIPKYKAKKFIVYFQNFSNTYLPLEKIKQYVKESCVEDIVAISFATRPDCVSKKYMAELAKLKEEYNVDIIIELGLQIANYHVLEEVNRGHTLAEYLDAMQTINAYGLDSCTHVILNLPNTDMKDVIETAKIISVMKSTEVKLHALYIIKNTLMAKQYLAGELKLISEDEYIERVITFLEYLDKDIPLQRLIGRAPASHTEFSNWGVGWWKIKEKIEKKMEEEKRYQGSKCDYLDGKALNAFK